MATEALKIKDPAVETEQALSIAQRYCCEFVDLKTTKIDHELFRTVPVDLMFRYHFVPVQAYNETLEIALSDPRQIVSIDELAVLLGKKLKVKVATYSQISDLLKKTEQSQRVLEEVTEGGRPPSRDVALAERYFVACVQPLTGVQGGACEHAREGEARARSLGAQPAVALFQPLG